MLCSKPAVAADQGEVYLSNPGQTVVSYPVRKWLNRYAMLKQSPDGMRLDKEVPWLNKSAMLKQSPVCKRQGIV